MCVCAYVRARNHLTRAAWQLSGPSLPAAPQKGDRVVYSKYAGTEVELQSANYIILKVGEMEERIRARV